jgi:hypothetical protein
MAHGQKKRKILDKTKGQRGDPTQAAAPSTQKYKYPMEKGLAKLNPKTGADGEPLALTGYGTHFNGPTAVAVADSDTMADIDIASDRDATLEALKVGAGSNNAVADQLRTVDATSLPIAGGGSMKRQQDANFFAKKPALPGK